MKRILVDSTTCRHLRWINRRPPDQIKTTVGESNLVKQMLGEALIEEA